MTKIKAKIDFEGQGVAIEAKEGGEGKIYVDTDDELVGYTFLSFHFHSPSEHTFNTYHYDAEAHFVFVNKEFPDELLYLAVLFDTDSDHWHASEKLFEHFDFEAWEEWEHEEEARKSIKIDLHEFFVLLDDKSYWHYEGSETIPPC